MDAEQSRDAFKQAEAHFLKDEYNEALQVLNQLNQAHPGTKNILFPMAQCMARTNRMDDAKKICDFLVEKFDHPGAKQMIPQLQAVPDPMADLGLDALNIDLDSGPSAYSANADRKPLEAAGPLAEAAPYLLWAGLIIAASAQRFFVVRSYGEETALFWETWFATLAGEEGAVTSSFAPVAITMISNLVFSYFIECIVSYLALMTFQALLHDDFTEDMKDVALFTFFVTLLMFVPFLGWIAAFVILQRHYEQTFGKMVLLVIVWIVYAALLYIPFEIFFAFAT